MAHKPPNTRRVFGLIDAKIRSSLGDLRPDQAMDLRSSLTASQNLMDLLKRSRLSRQKHPKMAKVPRPKRPKARPKYDKGIYIDGIRSCRLCKRPLPHKTKPEWQYHMLACKRRHMQKKSQEYYARVGWDKLYEKGQEALFRRSVERKLAIFKEECPLSAAKMSRADIIRLIVGYVNPKNGHMHGPIKFRRWVKRRFR